MRLFTRFSDEALIEGGQDAELRERAKVRLQARERVAMQSNKPELRRADIVRAHAGLVEHLPDGRFYSISAGEVSGEASDRFDAFIVEQSGEITFLQQPQSGARTRAELDEQRAAREAKRAEPKPRPTWLT